MAVHDVSSSSIVPASIQDFLKQAYAGTGLSLNLSEGSHNSPTSTSSIKRIRPFVTLTYAQSLDAKIAGKDGKQIQLSGEQSSVMTHQLRKMHDYILVGVGTLLNDDPQLNCRKPIMEPLEQQPLPCILDSKARTPIDCKLIHNAKSGKGHFPIIFCSHVSGGLEDVKAFEERRQGLVEAGCKVVEVPTSAGHLDLEAVLEALPASSSLMVEGGAGVINSFLQAGLLDRLIITVAPVLVGEDGVSVNSGRAEASTRRLEHVHSAILGQDTVVACQLSN